MFVHILHPSTIHNLQSTPLQSPTTLFTHIVGFTTITFFVGLTTLLLIPTPSVNLGAEENWLFLYLIVPLEFTIALTFFIKLFTSLLPNQQRHNSLPQSISFKSVLIATIAGTVMHWVLAMPCFGIDLFPLPFSTIFLGCACAIVSVYCYIWFWDGYVRRISLDGNRSKKNDGNNRRSDERFNDRNSNNGNKPPKSKEIVMSLLVVMCFTTSCLIGLGWAIVLNLLKDSGFGG